MQKKKKTFGMIMIYYETEKNVKKKKMYINFFL